MNLKSTDYFSGLADVYDANRPSYPNAAIDCVLRGLPEDATIVDIGCGTGISTRLLKARLGERGCVIGVDPNADMLRQASTSATPGIEYHAGVAEATGLPAGVAACVVVAQAFHWFKPIEALREFHRILTPHARLALIWNVRDDAAGGFTAAYSDLARRCMEHARANGFQTHELRSADAAQGGNFRDPSLHVFANPQSLTIDGLIGRARSASYFPRVGDPLRERVEHELARLFHEFKQDGAVSLMHRTEVTLATRA